MGIRGVWAVGLCAVEVAGECSGRDDDKAA